MILDYLSSLELFSPYEMHCLSMLVDEYCPVWQEDFWFLKDGPLWKAEIYWYTDRDESVLGGFHHPSGNAIFINRAPVSDIYPSGEWSAGASRIAQVFPTVVHELCHYWQSREYGALYLILQLPFLREITIERHAYRVSDYLCEHCKAIGMSVPEMARLKKEHGFPALEFDQIELAALERMGLDA